MTWIRRMLRAGLSTATIAEFQACAERGVDRDPGNCRLLSDRLSAERERIDTAIAELTANRAALDEMIGR